MDYGAIIKRSWQITWRYRALWLLGVFAGISGCQGGGSPNSGRNSGTQDLSARGLGLPSEALAVLRHLTPVLIAAAVALVAVIILWTLLGVAARGGLIAGVNAVEEGRELPLNELWHAGFSRWWKILGLGVLLQFPVFVVAMLVVVGVLIPLLPLLVDHGSNIGPASIVPMCGVLAVGVPILAVGGFVLGIMYLLGLRYLVLGDQGVVESAKNAWLFFRRRLKDCVLMYLINGGLNLLAGAAFAIPLFALIVAVAIPAAIAGSQKSWPIVGGTIAIGVMALVALSLIYNAIWGTYTSALWTLFFRQMVGMGQPQPQPQPVAEPQPEPEPTAESWAENA